MQTEGMIAMTTTTATTTCPALYEHVLLVDVELCCSAIDHAADMLRQPNGHMRYDGYCPNAKVRVWNYDAGEGMDELIAYTPAKLAEMKARWDDPWCGISGAAGMCLALERASKELFRQACLAAEGEDMPF